MVAKGRGSPRKPKHRGEICAYSGGEEGNGAERACVAIKLTAKERGKGENA